MKQRASLRVAPANGTSYENSPLVRSNINLSSSIHQEFLGASYSNHVFPLRLSSKRMKPELWQQLFDGKKQQELTTKKNRQKINVLADEDFPNLLNDHSLLDANSRFPFLPAPIQAHIDHLYTQIDDLTLQLYEERLEHKQARIKAKEILVSQLRNQEKQFQQLLQHKSLDHKDELKEEEQKYLRLLNEEQTQNAKREEQLRNELAFLRQSFHMYKINLEKENGEKIQIKIDDALAVIQRELPKKEEEMNTKINEAIMKERKTMNLRQRTEIENIRKQHQKEIETLSKTFTDTTVDREHFESLNKELNVTKLELVETKKRAINLYTQLKDLEIQHIETSRELNNYRI